MDASPLPNPGQGFLNKLEQLVLSNLSNEQFGVNELSKELGHSRSYLHRKIHLLKGQSASQFIREIRLKEAYKLLKESNLTCSEIAYRVGFGNPSYFSRVFAEHFHCTPGSIRKKAESDCSSAIQKESLALFPMVAGISHRFKRLILFAASAILVSFFAFFILLPRLRSETSLAVLPLQNHTGEKENDYFAAGMHDALVGELGQITSLRVISSTSTLRYRENDMLLKDIARELDVNIIIEGSLQTAGDSVRMLLQVIDVLPRERHIFSKEYDDVMHNVLNLQRLAAREISREIRLRLSKKEKQNLAKSRTINPDVYKDYLRGMYYVHQGTSESFTRGIHCLFGAIEEDPSDPLAYAGLALAYATKGHGMVDSKEAFHTAFSAAEKAIKLDPNCDEAYTALALLHLYDIWDWPRTREYFEHALSNNPNNLLAHAHYAWYYMLYCDYERAIYHGEKAVMLQPFSASFHSWLSLIYFKAGQYDECEHHANRTLEIKKDNPYGNLALGWLCLERGQHDEGIAYHEKMPKSPYHSMLLGYTYVKTGHRDKALELWRQANKNTSRANPFHLGVMAAYLGFTDQAFELLNEAYQKKIYPVAYLYFYPCTESLKSDPRFNDLLAKLNLPEHQLHIASK